MWEFKITFLNGTAFDAWCDWPRYHARECDWIGGRTFRFPTGTHRLSEVLVMMRAHHFDGLEDGCEITTSWNKMENSLVAVEAQYQLERLTISESATAVVADFVYRWL